VLQEISPCVSQCCKLQLHCTVLHDFHHAKSVQHTQRVSMLIQHVLLWACLIHKPALSVTMAACSSPCCQKDPVLACTAESLLSLLSATSKHIIMSVMRLTAVLCAGAGWQVQASTESCSCSLQRGPVLWCQLCCQHGWSQPDEVHGKPQLCIVSRHDCTPRNARHHDFGGAFRTQSDNAFLTLCETSQICQFKTLIGLVSFPAPLLRVDRLRTPSLRVSSRPATFHRDEEPVAPHTQWR